MVQNVRYLNGPPGHTTLPFDYRTPILSSIQMNQVFRCLVFKLRFLISFLAAKISTQETSQLGSQSSYMSKLLSIVQGKVTDKTMDVTLKFSLSALWNLTDESPQTCNVFLQEGGMKLFLQVRQPLLFTCAL